ncbi:MAG: lysoplasmalogenase family protein [Ardenticatenaceae bacterium]
MAYWAGISSSFAAKTRPSCTGLPSPTPASLATTTGLATALALQTSAFVWLAIGAALFLFSDLILAAQLFNGLHFRLIGDLVWLTYGPGQMMIVYSLANL